uniref:hypothetical protein n=1 Tax=Mesorhizobium amorphae TaxID=71433 RepID=UPI001AEED124
LTGVEHRLSQRDPKGGVRTPLTKHREGVGYHVANLHGFLPTDTRHLAGEDGYPSTVVEGLCFDRSLPNKLPASIVAAFRRMRGGIGLQSEFKWVTPPSRGIGEHTHAFRIKTADAATG